MMKKVYICCILLSGSVLAFAQQGKLPVTLHPVFKKDTFSMLKYGASEKAVTLKE